MAQSEVEAHLLSSSHLHEALKLPEQEILPQLPHLLRALPGFSLKLAEKASSQETNGHAVRTKIGSLLVGQSNAGRWIACTLIQTLTAQVTFDVVDTPAAWIRGLLALLNKPSTSSIKVSVIVSFTRIATAARPHATFMRETITPNLPPYLTSCYNLVSSDAQCRHAALDSLARLVQVHPTVFRPFENKLYAALQPMVTGSTVLDGSAAGFEEVRAAARLWTKLPFAAPKSQSISSWETRICDCIEAIHKLLDTCFRGIAEDWAGSKSLSKAKAGNELTLLSTASSIGGISRAATTSICLFNLLEEYMRSSTSATVSIPVGHITELCLRALLVPLSSDPKTQHPLIIHEIQIAALSLIRYISMSIGTGYLPLLHDTAQSIGWCFATAKFSQPKRIAIYETTASVLRIGGLTLEKPHVKSLLPVIRGCCDDALPLRREQAPLTGKGPKQRGNVQVDSILGPASEISFESPDLRRAASDLLPLITSHISESLLPLSIRALVDRASILSQNKEAMLNSVLYPPAQGDRAHPRASILPHLTRSFPGDSNIEGLIRPRLPALLYHSASQEATQEESDEEMEEPSNTEYETQNEQPRKRSLSITPPLQSPKRARRPLESEPQASEAHLESLAAAVTAQELNSSPSPTRYETPFSRSDAPPPETQHGPTTKTHASVVADEDSDDDDFSVPELTIGADTEDEDEIP